MLRARIRGYARPVRRVGTRFRAVHYSASQRLRTLASTGGHPVVYHEDFTINPIPDGHRFPMPKDALLYQRLQQLGLANNTFTPVYPDWDTIKLVHDGDYVEAFVNGTLPAAAMRTIGLPWSQSLVRRTLIGVGSAMLAARLALSYGVACTTNGGTHHAHKAHGSGWCIFNDLAVAAKAAQRDAGIGQVLLLDLDVHHGDGSAALFADDPSVYTCSMHCKEQAFPSVRPPSDMDVDLPAGTTDEEYLGILSDMLPEVLTRCKPDLVLYNAGVDVHADDTLGLLKLSDSGIAQREAVVMGACAAARVPVAAAIGGGYSPDHAAIVERHVLLHRAAALWQQELWKASQAAKRLAPLQRLSGRDAHDTACSCAINGDAAGICDACSSS